MPFRIFSFNNSHNKVDWNFTVHTHTHTITCIPPHYQLYSNKFPIYLQHTMERRANCYICCWNIESSTINSVNSFSFPIEIVHNLNIRSTLLLRSVRNYNFQFGELTTFLLLSACCVKVIKLHRWFIKVRTLMMKRIHRHWCHFLRCGRVCTKYNVMHWNLFRRENIALFIWMDINRILCLFWRMVFFACALHKHFQRWFDCVYSFI